MGCLTMLALRMKHNMRELNSLEMQAISGGNATSVLGVAGGFAGAICGSMLGITSKLMWIVWEPVSNKEMLFIASIGASIGGTLGSGIGAGLGYIIDTVKS